MWLAHCDYHEPLTPLSRMCVHRRVPWSSADWMFQVLRTRWGMHSRSGLVALGVSRYPPLAESQPLMITSSPEYHENLVSHQIPSYSLTISFPWQSTLSGSYFSIRGMSASPGARNPSLHGPRWQSTLYCGSLPSAQ